MLGILYVPLIMHRIFRNCAFKMGDLCLIYNIRNMKHFFFSLNFLFLAVFFNTVKAQVSMGEKQALIDFYNSASGDDWSNSWNLNDEPKNWYGITLRDNHVVAINLHKNNLQGVIPSTIKDLNHLEILNLAFNKITGELPYEITKLEQLRVLKLEMNRIKGSIPKMIGQLSNLEELVLFNNMLEGFIPESIGNATNLKVLNLSSNFLKGTLPSSIESLTRLKILELFGNKLSGTIDVDLGKLKNLSQIVLAFNDFEGAIPPGLEKLQSLQYVQLQGNKFNSFENLENLKLDGLATFDSDNVDLNLKYNPNGLNSNLAKTKAAKETRMADTKFENNN